MWWKFKPSSEHKVWNFHCTVVLSWCDKNKADVLGLKTYLVAITLLFCKATEIPSGWLKGSLFSCLSIFVVPLILKTNIRKADNGASTTSMKIWKILYKVDLSCHGTVPYQTWLKICWLYRLFWMRVTHMFVNYDVIPTRESSHIGRFYFLKQPYWISCCSWAHFILTYIHTIDIKI